MFSWLSSFVRAVFGMILVIFNTAFWCAPLFAIAAVKLLTPDAMRRVHLTERMANLAQNWIGVNNHIIALTQRVRWEITGLEGLSTRAWYLVCSNHLSGMDIPVIQKVFHRRIPFLRAFTKQELIWVPLLGQAWWALDYP
ncbi:MAG: 1-acyl-sn-glycerol-3-phosphate acyltransferase, partial [Caldilineaceae bacterium]